MIEFSKPKYFSLKEMVVVHPGVKEFLTSKFIFIIERLVLSKKARGSWAKWVTL